LDAYNRKRQEYLDLTSKILFSDEEEYESLVDRQRGIRYLWKPNELIPRIMKVILKELLRWFDEHPLDGPFLRQSAQAGMWDFLAERPDMVVLLRIAQTLPTDVERSDVPVDRPVFVEVIELAIGLIPVVGSLLCRLWKSSKGIIAVLLYGSARSTCVRGFGYFI
jgi:hypothetical protein